MYVVVFFQLFGRCCQITLKTTKTMETIMKEMLVSGLQAKVDNETFVKRVAYLLDERTLTILCTGIPVSILDYYQDRIKDILKRKEYNVLEVEGVYLTSDYQYPVEVEYRASIVRYFACQEDADKAAKDENRYAGDSRPSEVKPVSCTIRYTSKTNLTMDQAKECCNFEWL